MRIWLAASAAVLLMGCQSQAEQAQATAERTRRARAYCDYMGIRVTGVHCRPWGGMCEVAPENGHPFLLNCGFENCYLPEPAAR
jgi:hypothetical protein